MTKANDITSTIVLSPKRAESLLSFVFALLSLLIADCILFAFLLHSNIMTIPFYFFIFFTYTVSKRKQKSADLVSKRNSRQECSNLPFKTVLPVQGSRLLLVSTISSHSIGSIKCCHMILVCDHPCEGTRINVCSLMV